MNQRSWIVTLQAKGTSFARVWSPSESENEFEIGFPVRWVLERTESGVQIRSAENPALVREIDEETLSRGTRLDLRAPGASGSSLQLELRPAAKLPPVYDTHPGASGSLRVYPVRGVWTRDAVTLTDRYDGISMGRKLFRMKAESAARVNIQALDRAIEIVFENGEKPILLAPKEKRSFLNSELAGSTLVAGSAAWKLETLGSSGDLSKIQTAADTSDDEREILKRSFAGTAIILLFLLAIGSFWKSPEAPAPEPQKTKILLKKKTVQGLMTAAPKGDPKAHDTSIGQHGTRAGKSMAKKPSPVKKQASVASAQPKKSAPAHAPAPAPKAEAHHAAPSHSAHVAAKAASKPKSQARAAKPRAVRPSAELAALARAVRTSGKSGGMTSLLNESRFAAGSDAAAEAQGIASARSGLKSGGHSSGRLDAGGVSVAALGGGAGGGAGGGGGSDAGTPGYGRGSNAKVSGQGNSLVSLDTSASDVEDGLTKDQVGRVIHSHMSEIRYCYDAAVLRNPDTEGELWVHFTIGGNGIVQASNVAKSTVSASQLNQCVVSRLARWKFPKPKGGVNVAVTYPFIFKTLGR